jgi:hypothetical protein
MKFSSAVATDDSRREAQRNRALLHSLKAMSARDPGIRIPSSVLRASDCQRDP